MISVGAIAFCCQLSISFQINALNALTTAWYVTAMQIRTDTLDVAGDRKTAMVTIREAG